MPRRNTLHFVGAFTVELGRGIKGFRSYKKDPWSFRVRNRPASSLFDKF